MDIRPIVPSEWIGAVQSLMEEHWAETESNVLGGPKPSVEMYKACEDAGLSIAFGAFDGGALVGYVVVFLHRHLHYEMLCAQHDTLFLKKEYRSGRLGINLMRKTERACAERGASFIAWHAKFDSPFYELLNGLRYSQEEVIFRKELSCQ